MNKICRICLEEGVLSSIFVENYNISICEMIEYCSNIKISRNDGLPEQMCSNCMYKLGIAYHFKQTCERADVRLRQYLGIPKQSKASDAMVMTDPIVMTQTTIIRKCNCTLEQKKSTSNYKPKLESEKLKRGPKPKPKKIHSCYQCSKQFRCQAQLEMHISRNDGLPEQMCSNCMYKLGIAYHFKQTCERADVRLRQYLGIPKQSKASDAMVMTDPIVMTQTTIIRKCNCTLEQKKSTSNYKPKLESEKLKRGPKPKPKKIHSCYQCSKQFRCQAQLEMHVRTHTGDKPFVCMYCPQRFTQKHNLTIHQRVHTGEKPFQCEVCSKRFSAQGNLHAHLKIHTGQKDHGCTLCNKSFITSSELTRHMYKHRGVKNFKCNLCSSAYIHSRDLKLHKLKKHQINEAKDQNEFENSKNIIDIVCIDDVKSDHIKDTSRYTHLSNVKIQEHLIPDASSMVPYKTKEIKDMYHENEVHSCTICGEVFNFTEAYSQHCLQQHKVENLLH